VLSGVRGRLTLTIVALVILTAVVLGATVYVFVDSRLHDGAVHEAADQAGFDLSVLAPARLDNPPTDAQIQELADAFQRLGL